MNINTLASEKDTNQQINFNVTEQPHITLYLTTFLSDFSTSILQSVNDTLYNEYTNLGLDNCMIQITNTVNVSGSYALWSVENPPCLQGLSNAIVNATSEYVDPRIKNTIPSWVNNLPVAIRNIKMAMIRLYGSPNVYSQFQPQ